MAQVILFQALCQALNEDGWEYEYDEKNQFVRLKVCGVSTDFSVFVIVDEEQESILCNTYIQQNIPEIKRAIICEFMNRANYELENGNFEMDMDEGAIRYRTFLDLSDAIASKEQILNLIWNGPQCFDTYYPGLMKILYGDYSADKAAALCMEDVS